MKKIRHSAEVNYTPRKSRITCTVRLLSILRRQWSTIEREAESLPDSPLAPRSHLFSPTLYSPFLIPSSPWQFWFILLAAALISVSDSSSQSVSSSGPNSWGIWFGESSPSKELCVGSCAEQEDVSRKKTDEMKKRAIHTAASYDEFRHMVSCAQLTPLT